RPPAPPCRARRPAGNAPGISARTAAIRTASSRSRKTGCRSSSHFDFTTKARRARRSRVHNSLRALRAFVVRIYATARPRQVWLFTQSRDNLVQIGMRRGKSREDFGQRPFGEAQMGREHRGERAAVVGRDGEVATLV